MTARDTKAEDRGNDNGSEESQEVERKAKSKAASKKVVKLKSKKPVAKAKSNGNGLPKPSSKPYGQAGKALDGVQDPRLHPRAVRPDLHAASRLTWAPTASRSSAPASATSRAGQLRDVKGADSLYFTMLNAQQALDHDRQQASQGQGNPRAADQALRRAGRELRARRARPHGADLGVHPQDQPAHDRRVGEGLRPRPLRGLQGLRERRAMRRRLGLDHRLPRRPAARHRRADRRQRHRPASRAAASSAALYQRNRTGRGQKRALRDAGRRAQPRARQAARPAAPRRTARSPNTASTARAFRSATRRRAPATTPAAASPAGSSSARAGRAIPTPTSTSSPRRRCGRRSAT